ncbi:hypothetical protein [Paenibacillus sp. Root444D2]|nr:hypothetical protein [Paenibacillus sp. Root444D2]
MMKPLSGGFIQPVDRAIRYPYSQDVHVTINLLWFLFHENVYVLK